MIVGLRPAPPLVLPDDVATVVSACRDAVNARLEGTPRDRRLDLDDPGALDLLVAACRGEQSLPSFDAITSIVALPRFADVDAVARAVYRLVEPGGVVHLVEPVSHVGPMARFRATCWSVRPETRTHHLERDVPYAFRSNALPITDLERIAMPTRTWPLRRFIDARARREVPFGSLIGDVTSGRDLQEVVG